MSLHDALGGMRNINQYFVWRLVWSAEEGKYHKTPCAHDGSMYRIDASLPSNWGRYESVREVVAMLNAPLQCADRTLQYALGFWMTADCGYWFFDLDKAVGNAYADQLVAAFPGALMEWSSSQKGIHVIGRCAGSIPKHRSKPPKEVKARIAPLELEFYHQDRGIAFGLNGLATGSADTIHDAQIVALCAQFFPPVAEGEKGEWNKPRADWRGPADDDELIRRALQAKVSAAVAFGFKPGFEKLWRGDCEKNNETDMALASHLAFWTGCDAPRIERLMRASGLVRDKWDNHRTYLRELTIQRACDGCKQVYREPGRDVPASKQMPGKVRNATELLKQEFKPVQWAIQGIIPEGVTILSGDPKIGKSWLVYQMCVAIASGQPLWPGRFPEARGGALYLDLEGNDRRLQRRLRQLLSMFPGADLQSLSYSTEWSRAEAGVEEIATWLRKNPGCRIVVIDTVSAFRNNDPGRKSAYAHDYEVGEMLKPLAREFHCAVVLVMHNRKQAAGDVMHRVSGTQGMTGSVDNVLILERDRGGMDAALFVDGRDIEDPAQLAMRFESGRWRCIGNVEDVQRSQERNAVIEALKAMNGVGTAKDIHLALPEKKYGAVKTMLSRMVKAGTLRNEGGTYTVAVPLIGALAPPPMPEPG